MEMRKIRLRVSLVLIEYERDKKILGNLNEKLVLNVSFTLNERVIFPRIKYFSVYTCFCVLQVTSPFGYLYTGDVFVVSLLKLH